MEGTAMVKKSLIVSFAQLSSEMVSVARGHRNLLSQDAINTAEAEEQNRVGFFRLTVLLTTGIGVLVLAFVAYRVRKELHSRRAAEHRLLQAYSELDQFSSIVAHDLNGPLANISTAAQILERKIRGTHPIAEDVTATIRRETHRLHEMVAALLRLCRVASSKIQPQPVPVSSLIGNVRQGLQQKLTQSKALLNHDGLPYVWGDPALLDNMFQNLVENSIKYCRNEASPEISLTVDRKDNMLTIMYDDNGQGIPAEARSHVFEPFYQVPNRGTPTGVGLGLAVVQRIVKAHGGDVRIVDKPEPGTRFEITLPSPRKFERLGFAKNPLPPEAEGPR
jgi:signal transduction histidine kinase